MPISQHVLTLLAWVFPDPELADTIRDRVGRPGRRLAHRARQARHSKQKARLQWQRRYEL